MEVGEGGCELAVGEVQGAELGTQGLELAGLQG